MIPFLSFDYQDQLYRDKIIQAMIDVLDSKWYIMGNRLKAFEEQYAKYNEVKYAVGVANGLDALIIALKALNIGKGDEVIVPSNTYIATWLAVSAVGATIVPVEPDLISYNIDPNLIESAITKRTKAIMPVHLYGQPCSMGKIMEIAENNNLFIIEDNAQAHCATFNGKLTGTFGNINATSFYPGKNFGAIGDAGGITTDDLELFNISKIIRNYGSGKKYFNSIRGMNSRLDELQAAILSVKLSYLNKLTEERISIAQKYDEGLKGLPYIKTPQVYKEAKHVYHLYVILTQYRDELQKYLLQEGIQTLIHYPVPAHLQEAYADLRFTRGDFPIAEQIANQCLSLPIYPGMTDDSIDKVLTSIKRFISNIKGK